MSRLRLGFHYHVPAIQDGTCIRMPGSQGRFVDSIAQLCTEVVCFLHSPMGYETASCDHKIRSGNVRLVHIGPHASVPRRLLSPWRAAKLVRKHRAQLDVMLLRGPSPLLPFVARAASPLPLALLLVADNLAGVADLPQPSWRRAAIRWWETWNQNQQTEIAARSLTFVNSRKLYDDLRPLVPKLVETRTSTLSAGDFYVREDTCSSPPYRVLYCGRMATAKGLPDLINAVAMLIADGQDVALDLVGPSEKGDSALDILSRLRQRPHISDRVFYHGPKALGPELFQMYRRADLFVIASTSDSEGFPRVIWEAMAQSLPVIATRVASIPHYLKHSENAILVEPKDPAGLARAIKSVITDPPLRRQLIQNGFALAQGNTLELRASELMSNLQNWVAIQSCA